MDITSQIKKLTLSQNSDIQKLLIDCKEINNLFFLDSQVKLLEFKNSGIFFPIVFYFDNTNIEKLYLEDIKESSSYLFSNKNNTTTQHYYKFISSDFGQIKHIEFKNEKIQSISIFDSAIQYLNFQNKVEINQIICNNSVITLNKDRILSDLKITDITLINSELKNTVFNKCEFTNFILKNNDPKISKLNNCQFNTCKFIEDFKASSSTLMNVNFPQTVFEKRAEFVNSKVHGCKFSFAEFKDKADFSYANFYGKNNKFEYIHFKNRGAFYGAYFEQNPIFYNLILDKDSHLYFGRLNRIQNYKKKQETDEQYKARREKEEKQKKTEKNIEIKKLTIENTIINGRLDFNEDNITTLDMKGSIVVGTLSRVLFTPKCANWETATLLKNEELKQNNLIRALEYKAEEKELYSQWLDYKIINTLLKNVQNTISIYKKYLKEHGKERYGDIIQNQLECYKDEESKLLEKKKNLIKRYDIVEKDDDNQVSKAIVQLYFDRFSLQMSWAFNNHGQSWLRGICVTTGVWFIFFGLFYIPFPFLYDSVEIYTDTICKLFTSGQFFSNMVEYFNPTNYKLLITYITSSNPEWWVKFFGAFWYLLGKALIPYGAFEVVQAFRKYNKID